VSGSGLALPHNETYLSKWELGRCPLHYVANPQLFTPETLAKRTWRQDVSWSRRRSLPHKTKRADTVVAFFATLLLLAFACLGDGERSVVFEEVGEYAGGGMAVALLVVGEFVYLCEFDRGVVILDVGDPGSIVEIGRLPDTAQSSMISPTSAAT